MCVCRLACMVLGIGLLLGCSDGGGDAAGSGAASGGKSSGGGGPSTGGGGSGSGGAHSGGASGSPSAGGAAAGGAGGSAGEAQAPKPHTRCGWLGAGEADKGVPSFVEHADWFQAVHPYWYNLDSDGASIRKNALADDPVVISTASEHGVELSPMIATDDGAETLRQMLNDPDLRSEHVKNLVDLVVAQGYAGIDIDYEHLWESSDRLGYSAFIAELSSAMHAAQKQVSAAVPGLDTASDDNAWDYDALSEQLDTLHIMGYDFHSVGTHSGPVAPLGWIEAVVAHAESTGRPERFVLGVPNYGTTPGWYGDLATCAAACGPAYATTTDHMLSCPFGNFAAGRAPNCTTENGWLFFDDTPSLEEKVTSAEAHGLRGVTYWAMGGEPEGFFEMVAQHYP